MLAGAMLLEGGRERERGDDGTYRQVNPSTENDFIELVILHAMRVYLWGGIAMCYEGDVPDRHCALSLHAPSLPFFLHFLGI